MSKMLSDFKAFAIKGNVVDMAVGVIIGGGFSKVVSALVSEIIMPLISLLVGRISFTNWRWTIDPPHTGLQPIVVNYGMFLQTALDFFIIAFSMFIMIRLMAQMTERLAGHEAAAPKQVPPTQEEILLTEIRDLLKKQQKLDTPEGAVKE